MGERIDRENREVYLLHILQYATKEREEKREMLLLYWCSATRTITSRLAFVARSMGFSAVSSILVLHPPSLHPLPFFMLDLFRLEHFVLVC